MPRCSSWDDQSFDEEHSKALCVLDTLATTSHSASRPLARLQGVLASMRRDRDVPQGPDVTGFDGVRYIEMFAEIDIEATGRLLLPTGGTRAGTASKVGVEWRGCRGDRGAGAPWSPRRPAVRALSSSLAFSLANVARA